MEEENKMKCPICKEGVIETELHMFLNGKHHHKRCLDFQDILQNILWMANRYVKGRESYAPSMFKETYEKAKKFMDQIDINKIERDEHGFIFEEKKAK